MTYQTLGELYGAYQAGAISRDWKLSLDNDSCIVYDDTDSVEPLFEMHPHDVMTQALDLLQIPHESVQSPG